MLQAMTFKQGFLVPPDALPPLLSYRFRRFTQDTEFSRTTSHLTHYQENPKAFRDQDGTLKLSRVVHACNLAFRRTGKEPSLGYLARLCLKTQNQRAVKLSAQNIAACLFCQNKREGKKVP